MNLMDLFIKIGVDDQASGKIEALAGKLGNGLSTAADIAVKSVAAVSGAVLAVGGYAVEVGSSFEAQMSKVSAISGATGEDMDLLTQKAMQMGIDTQFSATEAGQALEYMAMAGWKTEQMLGGLEGIMNLAAASGEDLALVSDIVTDAMTAFGLAAEESGHFADVLAKASSNSNTNVAMMGETFKYVAPIAGTLGYNIEDTATAIGLMANAGIKGSQAGTSLRSMLTRLSSATERNAEYFAEWDKSLQETNGDLSLTEKVAQSTGDGFTELDATLGFLGITTSDASGNMRPLKDVMIDLRSAMSGLTQEEQAFAAKAIAGQEAMSGLLAIVSASDEDFIKLSEAIYDADGAAEQMAATMLDNLQGQMTLLKSSAEGFGLAIYEEIQQPLTDMASWAVSALNSITEAFRVDGVDGMVTAAGELIGQLVTGLTERLPDLIDVAINILNSFLRGITDNADIISKGAVETITTFINGILDILPDVVSAGLDLLISFVNGIVENLPELLTAATQVIEELCAMLEDPEQLEKLLDAAVEIIKQLGVFIVDNIPELVDTAVKIISNLVDYILDPENMANILGAALDIILALGEGLIKSAGSIAAGVAEITGEIIKSLFEPGWDEQGRKLFNKLWDGLKAVWPELEKWLTSVGDSILAAFTDTVNAVKGVFTGESNDKPPQGGYYVDPNVPLTEQFPELYYQNLYTDENGKIKFDSEGFTRDYQAHISELNAQANQGWNDFTQANQGVFQVNVNIDGETAASALIDPFTKLQQQKGAGYR
jgi:TP901 family phage tail tape measure protein